MFASSNPLPQYSGFLYLLIFNAWTDTTAMFELELCRRFCCLVILDVQKKSIMLIDVTNGYMLLYLLWVLAEVVVQFTV